MATTQTVEEAPVEGFALPAWLATALMVVFTVAVAQAVARGLDFECGCFGTADGSRVGARKLLENTGLTILAAISGLRPR